MWVLIFEHVYFERKCFNVFFKYILAYQSRYSLEDKAKLLYVVKDGDTATFSAWDFTLSSTD